MVKKRKGKKKRTIEQIIEARKNDYYLAVDIWNWKRVICITYKENSIIEETKYMLY